MAFSPESAIKTNGARDGEPIRVMVVDDSVIIRGLLTRILETESDISVVASVGNGKLALRNLNGSGKSTLSFWISRCRLWMD